jgi:ectoine hydroxylase-related dioxygenase (phytanoyl-CoA dioxygenase family)
MNQTSEIEVGLSQSQFERDGYLVLEGHFSPQQVDRAASAMRRLLDERRGEVVTESLRTGRRTFWAQAEGRAGGQFKFNDLHLMSGEVRDLALEPELASVLEGVLGEPAVLISSQNFQRGSSLRMHIDSLYTTPRTPHSLVAAWIALEDVHPDAGPLFIYPGSHRIPLYRFNDGTHHAACDEEADWFDYIDVQIRLRGLKQRKFLARKGDVLVWHSDLVHGGCPVRDAGRTRGSLACHYFGESDCRERGLDIAPLHGGYWMRRQRQAVRVEPAAFGQGFPFPEESYLMRHPDVREGVKARLIPSGEYHYRMFGYGEGRGV